MSDFLETFSMVTLGGLRTATVSGMAENDAEIVPGIYLSWDPEGTEIAVAYDSPDWAALSLDCRVQGAPRWLSLNLALAEGRFEPGDILGLVVEGYAAESQSLVPRLLSKVGEATIEIAWEDTIDLHPENGVSAALRPLESWEGIAGQDGYHTLVLGLPAQSATMTIRNMRVFLMPGARGVQAGARA